MPPPVVSSYLWSRLINSNGVGEPDYIWTLYASGSRFCPITGDFISYSSSKTDGRFMSISLNILLYATTFTILYFPRRDCPGFKYAGK